MHIRKLEEYEEHETLLPKRIKCEFDELAKKLDTAALEAVRDIAEMCYKDGLRDGMRFMDWLCEKTS